MSLFFLTPKLVYAILGFGKTITFKNSDKNSKFAILIPARNESGVIEDIFSALLNQNYPKSCFDVYVIVNSPEDKTIEIAKKYGYIALVCQNQKCKGDALDYALAHIYANKLNYDSFLIFDADNIPTTNFLYEMNKAVCSGYDIGIGYRNSKNWNDGWVASSTALTFSLVNTLSNKGRSKIGVNCIFSGTGYFISKKVLDKFQGWPFKTLTEDYEISLYATLNNLKTTYVENAEYFDEQPINLKTSCKQRVRWVKGFVTVRKQYVGKIAHSIFKDGQNVWSKIEQTMGVMPLALLIVDAIVYSLFQVGFLITANIIGANPILFAQQLIGTILLTYVVLVAITGVCILSEANRVKFKPKMVISTLIMNPLYMSLYVPIAIKAIFSNNIKWDKIEHVKTKAQMETESEVKQLDEDNTARETNKNI